MCSFLKKASLKSGLAKKLLTSVLIASAGLFSGLAHCQEPATTDAATTDEGLSATEIETLVGPIALYPDELMSIVLPASTFPLQIVQAARFLEKQKADEALKPDEDWDTSILSLLNYPEVIELMNDDLDWTWKLGEAVVNQQQDVMATIQLFRTKVDDAGNLETNEKIVVIKETEIIKIESSSPEVIYVPSYSPTTVVVTSVAPYPWVYSAPYPYYYSPAAVFWSGMVVGAAIHYGVHWHDHHHGHGYGDIDINRNTNINIDSKNVNRDSVRQTERSTSGDRGSANNWRSNSTSSQGGRPGRQPSSVSGRDFSSRSASTMGARVGDTRTSNRAGDPGSANRSGSRQTASQSANRSRPSTAATTSGRPSTGSFDGYQRGSSTATNSQRGMSSRSSMSRSSRGATGGGRRR
jgi:hypothetical protein